MRILACITLYTLMWFLAFGVQAKDPNEPALPPGCDVIEKPPALTYVRQPRATQGYSDRHGTIEEAANWQHTTDVSRVFDFSESDVVLDDRRGGIKVIKDCTGKPEICAAMEPAVSLDATRIIYTVCHGSRKIPVKAWGGPMLTGMFDFFSDTCELHEYDIAKGASRQLTRGHRDRMAKYYAPDRIVFTSDRNNLFAPWGRAGQYYAFPRLDLFTAKVTDTGLSEIKQIGHHESFVMNPEPTTDGRVFYSSWWGALPRTPGTPRNFWPIMSLDLNGADPNTAELGAHGTYPLKAASLIQALLDPDRQSQRENNFLALRGVAEIRPGVFCVTSYYRGNVTGANGDNYCWMVGPGEGALKASDVPLMTSNATWPGSGRFVPKSIWNPTPYAVGTDATGPRYNKRGMALGRAGDFAPTTQGVAINTGARGWCYEAVPMNMANRAAMGGEPTCKKEIRLTFVDMVTDPFDKRQTRCIAGCEDKWQAWGAKEVSTYQALMGQPAPKLPEPLTGETCELRIVNGREGEIHQLKDPNAKPSDKITVQGNGLDCAPGCNHAIKIEILKHWTHSPTRAGYMAERVHSITPLHKDGSAKIPVPCETPLRVSSVTEDGREAAMDNQPQSLAKGETRTCHGCHDAHSEDRSAELGDAVEAFHKTEAGSGKK